MAGGIEIDQKLVQPLISPQEYLTAELERQRIEIERRLRLYRGQTAPFAIENRIVVLVDDGVATGSTAGAALRSLRQKNPAELIFAAPVSPPQAHERLATIADRIIVPCLTEDFQSVSQFYTHFNPVDDSRVIALLNSARDFLNR